MGEKWRHWKLQIRDLVRQEFTEDLLPVSKHSGSSKEVEEWVFGELDGKEPQVVEDMPRECKYRTLCRGWHQEITVNS